MNEQLHIINRSLSSAVDDIDPNAVYQQAVTLRYRREVVTQNLSIDYQFTNLYESLLFKIHPREEIRNRRHVKELLDNFEIIVLPDDRDNKRTIDNVTFSEIYSIIVDVVESTEEITQIRDYTDEIREKTREFIEMCLEKI